MIEVWRYIYLSQEIKFFGGGSVSKNCMLIYKLTAIETVEFIMRSLVSTTISTSLLVIDVTSHDNDLCAIGRDRTNQLINGNWSYQGIDTTYTNKAWWQSECFDTDLVWGTKYNSAYTFYIMVERNTTSLSYYAYCSDNNVDPWDCAHWWVYNGTHPELDSDFIIEKCSYYTEQSDCIDSSYLTSLGIDATSAYCVDNSQYTQISIDGVWEYQACDAGLPYYHRTIYGINYYLHFDWCPAYWFIGADISTTSTIAYCRRWNLIDCNNNLREYNGTGFQTNTVAQIDLCTQYPTQMPSNPTSSPTDNPTPAPTDPTPAPTNHPSPKPISLPSGIPTYPTPSPTGMIALFCFFEFDQQMSAHNRGRCFSFFNFNFCLCIDGPSVVVSANPSTSIFPSASPICMYSVFSRKQHGVGL